MNTKNESPKYTEIPQFSTIKSYHSRCIFNNNEETECVLEIVEAANIYLAAAYPQ